MGGQDPKTAFWSPKSPFWGFWAPKNWFLGPKRALGGPCAKPYKNIRVWGVFWRAKGGKHQKKKKVWQNSPQNKKIAGKAVLVPKRRKSAKSVKTLKCVTFFALKHKSKRWHSLQYVQEWGISWNWGEIHENWWFLWIFTKKHKIL